MTPETVKAITEALQPLADKLGQGAEQVWEAYYRQTFINAWTTIFFWSIMLVATAVVGVLASRYFYKETQKKYSKWDSPEFAMWAWPAVAFVFGLFWLGIIVTGGVQPLINPVYQTVNDIVGSVKDDN